jgi:hypothetical protein
MRRRPRSIVRTLVFGSLLFSGCFGLAHVKMEMPPLVVQGVLLDVEGRPVANETLTLALADFYSEPETLRALTSGTLDPAAYGYRFCTVRSGAEGDFACRLSGESRYVGFMPPLMCAPSETTLQSFLVGVRIADHTSFAVRVAGTEAEVRVPTGPELELAKPAALGFSVLATPYRSKAADVLQLVIRRKPAG